MGMEDKAKGISADGEYGAKSDPRDSQVTSPMPGVNIVDRKGDHTMQEAAIIGGDRGYPFKLRTWEEKSQTTQGEAGSQ